MGRLAGLFYFWPMPSSTRLDKTKIKKFSEKILGSCIDRNLPWKGHKDPYKIWVSEIILQQTQVATGKKYYNEFIRRFPDVYALARANEDEVLQAWQGLGYYSRARNMKKAAEIIVSNYDGRVPDHYDDILALPGIGPYTAAAVLSFAFEKPIPVVDGNVIRLISRVFGIDGNPSRRPFQKEVRKIAEQAIDPNKAGEFNQKIMDMGATVCKPQQPICINCGLKAICYARNNDLIDNFPPNKTKTTIKTLEIHYLVLTHNQGVYLKRRNGKGIWRGLYEPITIDENNTTGPGIQMMFHLESPPTQSGKKITLLHKLTHRQLRLHFHFFKIRKGSTSDIQGYQLHHKKNFENFAFPQPVFKVLKQYFKDSILINQE